MRRGGRLYFAIRPTVEHEGMRLYSQRRLSSYFTFDSESDRRARSFSKAQSTEVMLNDSRFAGARKKEHYASINENARWHTASNDLDFHRGA
jgi:hypothetical protein